MTVSKETADYMNRQARELRADPLWIDKRLAADFTAMFGFGIAVPVPVEPMTTKALPSKAPQKGKER